jgi:tryptophan synthase alpha chain
MLQVNRIDQTFSRLKAENRAAFVAYIAAGDPTLEATLDYVAALEAAGVDVLELGVPFSDPLADGVVNQMAAQRALDGGATTSKVLDLIRMLRERGCQMPIVLFTYLNPIYTYGFSAFHAAAAAAGADGILLLDLPPDEAVENPELSETHGLKQIRLIAPTTPPERMKALARAAEGFIYYVSREGVTGVQESLASNIAAQVAIIKSATDVPVCVGFGISKPEQAAEVAAAADGVVVGSAIVRIIGENGSHRSGPEAVRAFVAPLVTAARAARGV